MREMQLGVEQNYTDFSTRNLLIKTSRHKNLFKITHQAGTKKGMFYL